MIRHNFNLKKTLAITWWSTWGHITPLVAFVTFLQTSNEIKEKCNHIIRIGEHWWPEEATAKSLPNVQFLPIYTGKRRRYRWDWAWRKNIIDIGRVCIGIIQSLVYIIQYNIDIVFGKWGYVSLPLCIAAKILWKKVYIHESDLHPWLANRLIFPFAKRVFSWFPLPYKKAQHIWQLLSLSFVENNNQRLEFNSKIKAKQTTNVLVLWWSQWASSIFDALYSYCQKQNKWFHFYVTLWTKNMHYKEKFASMSNWVTTYEYLDPQQMSELYLLWDLAITRWGATSLAEQKLFGIRSAIIPLPYTGWNHQYINACWYRDTYDDLLIKQDEHMIDGITKFLNDHQWYKKSLTRPNTDLLTQPYKIIVNTIFA
jgi:UDP-N-acetylglucosamine--N-acetylmuramyl-(pentapeptide) pyrophosphoryl-undecaprenol N-acetylglucosamine transferase